MNEITLADETGSFRSNLERAQRDGPAWGFLEKGENGTKHIATLGDQITPAETFGGPLLLYHLNRLLDPDRSSEENDFANGFIHNIENLAQGMEFQEKRLIRKCIIQEGFDCCLWWTLSPYIYTEIKLLTGEREALRLLLEWAKSGKPIADLDLTTPRVNLTGLVRYNQMGESNCTFTLGKDSHDFSHQFAGAEAKRLVKEVFLPTVNGQSFNP